MICHTWNRYSPITSRSKTCDLGYVMMSKRRAASSTGPGNLKGTDQRNYLLLPFVMLLFSRIEKRKSCSFGRFPGETLPRVLNADPNADTELHCIKININSSKVDVHYDQDN